MRDLNPYFPGDAPDAEVLGLLGGVILVLALVFTGAAVLLTSRHPRVRRLALVVLAAPGLVGMLAVGFFVKEVGARHFGEWAELKALLQHYSAQVSQRVRTADGYLPPDEYRAVQESLLTPAPTFQFRGTSEPVQLRMMMSVWPYVGVDFGHGANAVFNPTTMVCIYSD